MANVPGFGTVIVPTWMGNSDIEPEDIESYEIGLHSQLASGFETDIKLFSYEISKHIVAAETEVLVPPFGLQDVDTSANAESSKVRGVEIGVGYTGHEKVGFNAGFSLVDAKATNENFEKSIPDYTAFISVLYRINRKHEVSSAFYYQDEITWLDGTSDVPISRRLDLRYSYHLNNELNIELIGQNLLEDFEDYEEENVHDQVIYLRLSGGF